MEEEVLFSIFMCARNAEGTMRKAIGSVLAQTCLNWELIVVDNESKDGTWMLIEDMMKRDSRMKGIHLEQGIGWEKGFSLCLENARGKYMTFLAADDFFLGDGALEAVEKCLEAENPDIVWVGHAAVQLENKAYKMVGGIIPEYKVYRDVKDKITEIFEIMNNLYYNSFFHFVRLEHLKKQEIDFKESFLADSEILVEAACRAEKTVVLNQAVYALNQNTSQVFNTDIWREDNIPWKSIKRTIYEKGVYDQEKLRYIATRILDSNMTRFERICAGSEIQNRERNTISKTTLESLQYIEQVLEKPEYQEMFYYAGRNRYLGEMIKHIKLLYERCRRAGYSEEEVSKNVKWLDRLILGFYKYVGGRLWKRTTYDKACFENMKYALCHEANTGMFGYELMEQIASHVTEELQEIWQEISDTYMNWNIKKIYELLFIAVELKKRGRMSEVIVIVKEGMNILQQIKPYISEKDLNQATNDLKMVCDSLF